MKLKGKRVVITGASSGIGRLLMRRLVCAGAQVIGVARDAGPIVREFGSDSAIECDVSSPMQIDAMLDEAARRLWRKHALNAGSGVMERRNLTLSQQKTCQYARRGIIINSAVLITKRRKQCRKKYET